MKKVWALLLAAIMVISLLSGCSSKEEIIEERDASSRREESSEKETATSQKAEESDEESSPSTQQDDAPPTETEAVPDESTENTEPEQTEEPEEILIPHAIYYNPNPKIYEGYSEGYCWAYFDDGYMIGLMDHTARLVFFSSARSIEEDIFGVSYSGYQNLYTTPFQGGFTVLYHGESLNETAIAEGFIVLDGNGEILFNTNDQDESTSYYYLGRTHDEILVKKETASFAEKKTTIYTMDPYGNPTMDPIDYINIYRHMTEVADGIFTELSQIHDQGLGILNLNAEQPFYIENYAIYSPISGGYFVTNGTIGFTYGLMPLEALESQEKFQEFRNAGLTGINSQFYYFGEGFYGTGNGIFYDMNGQEALRIEAPGQASIRGITAFNGGYAAVEMTGADGNNYITLIDTQGQMQYEPIRIEKALYMNNTFMYGRGKSACQGYIPVYLEGSDDICLITPDGRVMEQAETDWSETFDLYIPDCDPYGGVASERTFMSDGFMSTVYTGFFDKNKKTGYGYLNLKTWEAFLDGYEVVTGSAASGSTSQTAAEDSSSTEKEYINPSSYIIEGKWKSIGSYGFGQAQPGAVVTFDGVHCNLYSPSDTYAFYKSGDKFILDCTSALSGTVSFTVKIVDENHIDLYNGGYVTELMRIE